MRFEELAVTSRAVAETSGRLDKIARLADCVARLEPDERRPGIAMLAGGLRQGRIGLGYAAARDAAAIAPAATASLELLEVDAALSAIAAASGRGSAQARAETFQGLLARATAVEQGFLVGLVAGGLRQGAEEGVMVEALARAAHVPSAALRRAAMLGGDLALVGAAALAEGAAGLSRFVLEPGRPVGPMLAQTAGDVGEALTRLGPAVLEHKLDGARVQVHRVGDDVHIFTRELHDVTARLPEIVEVVRGLPVGQVVLDGEALALGAGGRPQPFQVTMRRFGRKRDAERLRESLPLSPFFFDVLHVDGEDLLDQPVEARVEALRRVLPEALRVPQIVPASAEEAAAFLREAIARGHEGVMAKALASRYEAGRRGAAWLKIKPAHTLDLVVLAVEPGSGRRQGWLSNIHLGARDPATGGFVMLGKTFKGMTDAMLAWQTEALGALAISRDAWVVTVRPELVVEVAFDGVQQSSQYPGGLALRFARVVRYRPDKPASEADTIDTVRAIFAEGRS